MLGVGVSLWRPALGRRAFSPASLFASGEQGGWWDPSDLSTMSQNSDGTGAAAVGQPVGRILDKSGRGNHLTQTTTASKPILRQSGALYDLEFDGVDDGMIQTAVAFGAAMDVSWIFHNSGASTSYLPIDSAGAAFVGVAQDANASTPNTGGGTTFVNGVQLATDTRDALHDAIGSAGPKVIQAQGVNLSGFTNLRISAFGGFLLNGRLRELIISPAQSAAVRAQVLAYLTARAA